MESAKIIARTELIYDCHQYATDIGVQQHCGVLVEGRPKRLLSFEFLSPFRKKLAFQI
jgi:hypothetical protein